MSVANDSLIPTGTSLTCIDAGDLIQLSYESRRLGVLSGTVDIQADGTAAIRHRLHGTWKMARGWLGIHEVENRSESTELVIQQEQCVAKHRTSRVENKRRCLDHSRGWSFGNEEKCCRPFLPIHSNPHGRQFVCSNAGDKPCQMAARGGIQRIRAGVTERVRSDLLTARFRVRVPVPEPTFEFVTKLALYSALPYYNRYYNRTQSASRLHRETRYTRQPLS